MERLALPRGETARQFTKLMLSLLSHIGMKCWWDAIPQARDSVLYGLIVTIVARPLATWRCIAAMLATRKKHDAKAESNRRSQACEVLAGTGVRVAKKRIGRA